MNFDFDGEGGQHFATVFFDREEDDTKCLITIVSAGVVYQSFIGNNKYNPSPRRISQVTYLINDGYEVLPQIAKIATVFHKGNIERTLHKNVKQEEMDYLFGKTDLKYRRGRYDRIK